MTFQLLTLIAVASVASIAVAQSMPVQPALATPPPVKIPFELVNRHIVIKARVNDSAPLSFVLDTGDKFAIINVDRARALNLALQGKVSMAGAGANMSSGAFVRDATFTIPGLEGFSQPLSLALPLSSMSSSLGQDFDGIIGADFIERFVVEVDYQSQTLTLHNKDAFSYSGPGEILPIKLNGAGHPEIEAEVTPLGTAAVKGKFVVDMGSGLALALYSPFVRERNLLNGLKTISALGGRGAGGVVTGKVGRVAALKIGKYTIGQPITFFSEDQKGAFAIDSVLGNIGAQIMTRFRVFLDYGRSRIILEPNARFADPFDRAFAGFNLLAEGADYRTFRVEQILPDSPATDANLQQDDIIVAVDDKPASRMTLTTINQIFERPASFKLTVRRKDQTLNLKLTTRRMI